MSEFILVVEDDVYPTEGFLDIILERVIPHLIGQFDLSKLGSVKLYYGNFNWNQLKIRDLFLFTIIMVPAAAAVSYILSYLFSLHKKSKIATVILFLLWCGYISLVMIAIDKVDTIPHLPGLYDFHDSCCSLAHLYSKQGAEKLAMYLEENQEYPIPVDLIIDHWTRDEMRHSYVYQPHLFQHIGAYTTRPWSTTRGYDDMIISPSFPEDIFDGEMFP